MGKTFNTNDSQTRDVNEVIRRYKDRIAVEDPEAKPGDADALMAFAKAWDYSDAKADLPGSSDMFRAFDAALSEARAQMTAVARLAATEREAARLETAGELDALRAEVAALTAEVSEVRAERDEFRAECEAKDATIAELTAKVEQSESMAAMIAKVTAYVDANSSHGAPQSVPDAF